MIIVKSQLGAPLETEIERLRIGNCDLTGWDIASEIFKSTGFRISTRDVEEHKRELVYPLPDRCRKRDPINFRIPNPRTIIPRHVLYGALCSCRSGVCCAAALYDVTLFRRQQSVMHKAARRGDTTSAAQHASNACYVRVRASILTEIHVWYVLRLESQHSACIRETGLLRARARALPFISYERFMLA